MDSSIQDFEDSIVKLDVEKATVISKKLLGSSDWQLLFDAIERALNVVGEKYEAGEYFLSELIMAGEVVREILSLIDKREVAERRRVAGTIVLATVKGDIHDIGKNIVATLLRSSGFEIIDLGTDVGAESIASSLSEKKADILGLSALLTTTLPEFRNVTDMLRRQGQKERVKIIAGGAAVNEKVLGYGVDAWAKTAVHGMRICKAWATEPGTA
jgi:methylmalonyl-CoA mutase cobalamin-binding domain/chain